MNNYDIIIIGGGISGFFCMYKLIKKYPKLKVLLLEKNERFGGRIYTYCEKVDNIKSRIDLSQYPNLKIISTQNIGRYALTNFR